jgi:cephalosporin hydroxylase
MALLHWIDDQTFRIGRVTFHLSVAERFTSTGDNFLLVKRRHIIDRYLELLARLCPSRIVELGICEGGSAAFFALAAKPELFVAVDLKADPTVGLEDFIRVHRLGGHVHTHYSVDQADRDRLTALVDSEFGAEPLDLVVDDASHRLGPTRASFNVLFPRLRPGGVFVIEDWSSVHHIEVALEARIRHDPTARAELERRLETGAPDVTPLTVLLFELVLASAYAPDVFPEVFVTDNWAYVVRGPGAIDRDGFDVTSVYSAGAAQLLGRRA